MDLTQQKLSKSEWEYLEVPADESEMKILSLIYNSFNNVNYSINESQSLLSYMKLNSDEKFHIYLYKEYFHKKIRKLIERYNVDYSIKISDKKIKTIKACDMIRLKNCQKKIDDVKDDIYEFVLIKIIGKFFKKDKCPKNYYTLSQLIKNNISNLNIYVKNFTIFVLEHYKDIINKEKLIKSAYKNIEKNELVFKYLDTGLYSHQKSLFTSMKREGAKLVLYQAPTGTGKTMSPVGLAKGKKVIFTCAAKHIGLQLAKACISMEIPIAIAFGCRDTSDIRLHYFAAKDFTRNRRTGGIFRVDNSNGEKVQLIITDIQSFQPAMNYMLAFNEPDNIIWYWDEPTITLDYDEHEFHPILQNNWKNNEIPNVVLSSATLPNIDDIMMMTSSFKHKFSTNNVEEIKSFECKKSIPILDSGGNIVMPHYIYDNFKQLKKCARHIEENKTILRHIDVGKMIEFIMYVNNNNFINDTFKIDNYFETIGDITIMNLKIYYLRLLTLVKKNYDEIYQYFQEKRTKMYDSVIKITTEDAYTLTDGPTIFITENVEQLGLFYLKVSMIPDSEIENILGIMEKNERFMIELERVEKIEQQRKDKIGSQQLEKDHTSVKDSTFYKEQQEYMRKVKALKKKINTIELSPQYVPNSTAHKRLWSQSKLNEKSFKSDIDEPVVEQIMYLNVNKEWKILLLMGIGVFTQNPNKEYLDIMKKMAEQQKLYLIIASSDYIYGTNYQFCHGYLSKDLLNMTQEKMIQAFGRVGRSKSQSDYTLRLRDDRLIEKLYTKDLNKPEIRNMNTLFV
jgi:hypothetical protein